MKERWEMKDLRGRVGVVTGGASGIGFALAERFAAEGMGVVIADVEEAALEEAAGKLRATGADVLEVVTDVRDADQVEALAERTMARFGSVHIVCNNAGVAGGAGGQVWEVPLQDWEWTLGVNLWGVIHGVRTFVPRLVAQGEGHVVNTASMAGLITGGLGPYGVSKFGVVALSESLFLGLQATAPAVGVSVLCPGWVNTRIADSERNRPADLVVERADPLAEKARKGLMRVLESGLAPSEVADKVVAAIRENRFYVLPHDDEDWLAQVRERMTDILDRRNPARRVVPGSAQIMAAMMEAD